MNRDIILEAAAQVFRQKGYHGASMADIAEAVQLQKASLYHHFASKQEMLLELLDKALYMVVARMRAELAAELTADEKLRRSMRTYLQALKEQGDLVSVLVLEYRSLESELYERHISHRDEFEQMWRSLLQEGIAAGIFECENVALTVRALLGALNWTITWYRPTGQLPIEEIADHYARVFIDGLSPRRE